MQTINGYIENGRFIPDNMIKLPKRGKAVLVYTETEDEVDDEKEKRLLWLKKLNDALEQSKDEEMPDFLPRSALKTIIRL